MVRGQVFSFLITITSIVAGVVLTFLGKDILGIVALIAPLSGLVSSFIAKKAKERQ